MQELKERQETPDPPEALSCIPSLQLAGVLGSWLVRNPWHLQLVVDWPALRQVRLSIGLLCAMPGFAQGNEY